MLCDTLIFNNSESLASCEQPRLERKLGMRISAPYHNAGAGGLVCDIQREHISVNTTSSIDWAKPGDITTRAVAGHEYMIARLDTVIEELQQHRARLEQDKVALIAGEVNLDEQARATRE